MATPFSAPINMFLTFCEEDRNFFQYLNLSELEASVLVEKRSTNYLHEACARISNYAPNKSDFANYDDDAKTFGFDLTKQEIYLVASLMYESYMFRDISRLKCLSRDYSPPDLRVFDPSNARKTFESLYRAVCERNENLLDAYRSSGPDGKWLNIDFAAMDIDSD